MSKSTGETPVSTKSILRRRLRPQAVVELEHWQSQWRPALGASGTQGWNLSTCCNAVCAALTAFGRAVTNNRFQFTVRLGVSQPPVFSPRTLAMSISERKKEIKRRRKRAEKLVKLKKRLPKATKSEQVEMARRLRDITPGAEVVIGNWGLAPVDR